MSAAFMLILLFLLSVAKHVHCQDPNIYGQLIRHNHNATFSPSVRSQANRKCYNGMGFFNCMPKIPTDDVALQHDMSAYLNFRSGVRYCLECCGTNPNKIDVWNFNCTDEEDSNNFGTSNLPEAQFVFAKKRYLGDTAITSCPLPRTDGTYLKGYTLTLYVTMYQQDFFYWNGVTSCSAVAIEQAQPLVINVDHFTEDVIIIYTQKLNLLDVPQLGFLALLFFLVAYVTLYFCRRRHCIVCQKKLVFNMERCYICIFVGAYPPDPTLLKALEEKGAQIQDEPPERFLGARFCVATVRALWAIMCLQCCRSGCCKRSKKIVPTDTDAASTIGTAATGEGEGAKAGVELAVVASKKSKKMSKKKSVKMMINDDEEGKEEGKGGESGPGGNRSSVKDSTNAVTKVKENPADSKPPFVSNARPSTLSAKGTKFFTSSSLSPTKNPNKLPYPPHIIYAAIQHHDYQHVPDPGPKNTPESAPGFKTAIRYGYKWHQGGGGGGGSHDRIPY